VIVLLEHGANINKENKDGWMPLHFAASNGEKDTVIALLEHGANINKEDKDGWTSLHYALLDGNKDTVIALLEHGANINQEDKDGWTPQHFQTRPLSTASLPEMDKNAALLSFLSSLHPNDHIYPSLRGNVLWEKRCWDEAIICYERALQLDPQNSLITQVDRITHAGFGCDDCKQLGFMGICHRCMQCKDFDLCHSCFLKPIHPGHPPDSNHEFRSIPSKEWKPSSSTAPTNGGLLEVTPNKLEETDGFSGC
jgi:tetratricopeptide (TPR) repeat protein